MSKKENAFPTIAEWLDWQRDQLRQKASQPGFALVEKVVLKDPRQESSGFDRKGSGEARFTWDGMLYQGEIDGKSGERWFPKEHLAMIPTPAVSILKFLMGGVFVCWNRRTSSL